MSEISILSVAALIVAIANWLWTQFKEIAGLKERLSVVETKCHAIETLELMDNRLASIETKMELFWKFVSEKLTDMLMHPHSKKMDALLAKLKEGDDMDATDLMALKVMLEKELKKLEEEKSPTMIAAAFVIGRVEQLLADRARAAIQKSCVLKK